VRFCLLSSGSQVRVLPGAPQNRQLRGDIRRSRRLLLSTRCHYVPLREATQEFKWHTSEGAGGSLGLSGSCRLAGLLGKKWGFSRSVRKAPVFYGLVALGTIGGTLLSLAHVNPIKLLVLVGTINGVAAAPFLAVVMLISGSHDQMGEYANGRAAKTLGWATTALMAVAAIAMFATGGVSL
jgi:Mn2+/Fe2+ NRAMP family transporter